MTSLLAALLLFPFELLLLVLRLNRGIVVAPIDRVAGSACAAVEAARTGDVLRKISDGRTHVWLEKCVESALTGIVKLLRQSGQVGGLVDRCPVDAEPGALG